MTGYILNIAIGLQVFLGAMTTGLSAALNGRQAQICTVILGGFSTIIASYLARARGSGEPESSISRRNDLDQFLREVEAFNKDHGDVKGPEFDGEITRLRRRFEEILGNSATGDRKLPTSGSDRKLPV